MIVSVPHVAVRNFLFAMGYSDPPVQIVYQSERCFKKEFMSKIIQKNTGPE